MEEEIGTIQGTCKGAGVPKDAEESEKWSKIAGENPDRDKKHKLCISVRVKGMGKLVRVANGHYSYDIEIPFDEEHFRYMLDIAENLIKNFRFEQPKTPIAGPDGTCMDLFREGIRITIGWDIWSGLFVMAHCDEGDGIIRRFSEEYSIERSIERIGKKDHVIDDPAGNNYK